jgi:hypothetical protein
MKKLFLIILAVFLFASISSAQKEDVVQKKKSLQVETKIAKDSTEYDLIIFDIGFDSWFAINDNESQKRSLSYYEHKNQFYVIAWNDLYTRNIPSIDCRIEYESTVRYGFDLNYKLYMYFKYFEKKNKIKLINL